VVSENPVTKPKVAVDTWTERVIGNDVKKSLILISAAAALFLSAGEALAQKKYAGSYVLTLGYAEGSRVVGSFGVGSATAFRDGSVIYSVYFPSRDVTYPYTAVIRRGVFFFQSPLAGQAKMLANRVAYCEFSDSLGAGFFNFGR